jgi:hypothetical protein
MPVMPGAEVVYGGGRSDAVEGGFGRRVFSHGAFTHGAFTHGRITPSMSVPTSGYFFWGSGINLFRGILTGPDGPDGPGGLLMLGRGGFTKGPVTTTLPMSGVWWVMAVTLAVA